MEAGAPALRPGQAGPKGRQPRDGVAALQCRERPVALLMFAHPSFLCGHKVPLPGKKRKGQGQKAHTADSIPLLRRFLESPICVLLLCLQGDCRMPDTVLSIPTYYCICLS